MKKTLLTCMAVIALFAIASSASAIVCTIDQRPAATLLVPYFQVAVNSDGSIKTGAAALDTHLVIANASSAPMLAHVTVYNERSVIAIDFMIALTGFDVQSMRMSDVITGHLPQTPVSKLHASPDVTDIENDPCERNVDAAVFPDPGGYLRVSPQVATSLAGGSNDLTLATTLYPNPAFPSGGAFAAYVMAKLTASDTHACLGSTDTFPITNPTGIARGYVVIDHANYCTVANPSDVAYWGLNAGGYENNLFGEVIFTSGSGLPTFGASTVNIEASTLFDAVANGGYFDQNVVGGPRERTFYARYWAPAATFDPLNTANATAMAGTAPWDVAYGDSREPLGLKYATRFYEISDSSIISNLRVWRASAGSLSDLQGDDCTATEPVIAVNIYDEDENSTTNIPIGPCPSPFIDCLPTSNPANFGFETQRVRPTVLITLLPSYTPPGSPVSVKVGWLSTEFVNLGTSGNFGGLLDQAWMEYEFQGAGAFINAAVPGTQLDPTACHPLLLPATTGPTGREFVTNGTFTIAVIDVINFDLVVPGGHNGILVTPATGTGPTP